SRPIASVLVGQGSRRRRYMMTQARAAALAALLAMGIPRLYGQASGNSWADELIREIRTVSFPELAGKDIRAGQFTSSSDFFQARFSVWRFVTGRRMRYVIRVNAAAALRTSPEEGRRAIVAHELAHVAYYAQGNRLRLIGLLRFPGRTFRERFEKNAD